MAVATSPLASLIAGIVLLAGLLVRNSVMALGETGDGRGSIPRAGLIPTASIWDSFLLLVMPGPEQVRA